MWYAPAAVETSAMRLLPRLAALLFLFSSFGPAQDRLQVVSTTPLSKNILMRLGGGKRVSCPQDGGTLFGLTPAVDTNWRMTHELIALKEDGTPRAMIDLDKVPGMGMAFIEDFAPGPDGEIYVAAKKIVATHSAVDQKGQIYERYHEEDPQLWVLRFSDTGRVIAVTPIQAEFAYVHLGVFPSGSFLVVGYLSQASLPGEPPPKDIPYAAIFSREGKLVREVKLPNIVLIPEPRDYGSVEQQIPMLGADGNMYVVVEPSEKPALTVLHPNGAVSGTVQLRIPDGFTLTDTQLAGQRLIANADEIKLRNGLQQVLELNVGTGDLVKVHSLPEVGLRLSCQTNPQGIVVLGRGGLDTLVVGGDDNSKRH